ncbi:MAG: alanine racemase [Elusimicrobia bacterium]|nr:alanine racemase [Elusimicrobiota bacterium]
MKKKQMKWIEIDLDALADNARQIKKTLGAGVKLMAAVKSNAYGHGMEKVCLRLSQERLCDAFGVWSAEEAERIVQSCGKKTPAQTALLAPLFKKDAGLEHLIRRRTWFTLDRKESFRIFAGAAASAKSKAKVFLDIDLGLGRWGCLPKDALSFGRAVLKNKHLELIGISSHIDYVPGLNRIEACDKIGRFLKTAETIERLAGRPLIKTCANTSVFLDFPQWRLDMVRIGNLLYGYNPAQTPFPVKNIWSFKAKILNVRDLRRGETIGYGSEFLALKPMRIASIGVGFADGLTMEPAHRFIRLAGPPNYYAVPAKTKMKTKCRRLPLIGRVGLGHAILDISHAPGINVGDIVELPVRRTAASLDVPRIYIK